MKWPEVIFKDKIDSIVGNTTLIITTYCMTSKFEPIYYFQVHFLPLKIHPQMKYSYKLNLNNQLHLDI